MKPLPMLKMPAMRCDDGCGACCGIVLCREDEYQAVEAYARENGIIPKAQGVTCPFFQGGTCKVYPVRPFVCQLFGHSKKLPCPRGHNVNIPTTLERKLNKKNGKPTRWLHEMLGEGWQSHLLQEVRKNP